VTYGVMLCTGGSSNVGGSEATNRQGGLSSTNRGGRVRGGGQAGGGRGVLARYPIAVQLRYLQTLREVASERTTITTFLSELLRQLREESAKEPRPQKGGR